MTQTPCCWKAKWVTLTDLCKSSQDGLGQLPWPGQKQEWECWTWAQVRSGLDWLTTATPTALGVLTTALRWEKLAACKCMGITLDEKSAEMHQPLHGRALGLQPWAKPWWRGEELQQHPAPRDLRGMPAPWLQPKGNTPDCPCGLQSAAQAGTESHFTFLNNSETNTQTQTYFGHSQTRSGPRRRRKTSILLTPNWFYDSMIRHYSASLNDIHDLILQKLPHFLGQSPNIIF